jgi:hypothetical protein
VELYRVIAENSTTVPLAETSCSDIHLPFMFGHNEDADNSVKENGYLVTAHLVDSNNNSLYS